MSAKARYEHLRAAYELLDECQWYAIGARYEAYHAKHPPTETNLAHLIEAITRSQELIQATLTAAGETLPGKAADIDPPNRPLTQPPPSDN